MNIKTIVALLKDRADDPHTTVYDLHAIAVSALKAIEDADANLRDAIDDELDKEEPTINMNISYAIEDAVRNGDSELEELAEKLQ